MHARATVSIMALLITAGLLSSCGRKKKTKSKKKVVAEIAYRAVRVARGDKSQILPLTRAAVEGLAGMKVAHQGESTLVVRVRQIPGTRLRIPTMGGKRYYLRIDLKQVADKTHLALHFFRGTKDDFFKEDPPDTIVSRGAKKLFAKVFGAVLKSGVVFMK